MLKVAVGDPDSGVRASAVDSLGFRAIAENTVATMSRVARADAAPSVRSEALRLLDKSFPRFPDVYDVFVAARDQDPTENVRRLATSILLRLNAGSRG